MGKGLRPLKGQFLPVKRGESRKAELPMKGVGRSSETR
jgi:hypothetical protein